MATKETVKIIFVIVYAKTPDRKPKDQEEARIVFELWCDLFKPIPDKNLLEACKRFVGQTTKVYPSDDPFAIIKEMASPLLAETEADCLELVDSAVSCFGFYREDEALAWIESKSPLAAATIRRFGFQNYCSSENAEVSRGQLRSFFQAMKAQSKTNGFVNPTAANLENGRLPQIENLTAKIGLLPGGTK